MSTFTLSRGLGVFYGRMDRIRSAHAHRRQARRVRRASRHIERLDGHTLRDIGLIDGVFSSPGRHG